MYLLDGSKKWRQKGSMTPAEHHVPEVNVPKHSFLSTESGSATQQADRHHITFSPNSERKNFPSNMARSSHPSNPKRSAKSESIIGAMCQWTVKHQIGILDGLNFYNGRLMLYCRTLGQLTPPACPNAPFLTSSSEKYSERLSIVLL